jgi:hypothetical protein
MRININNEWLFIIKQIKHGITRSQAISKQWLYLKQMLQLWRWLVHFHDWNLQPPLRRRNVLVCKNRRRNVFVFRQHPVTMLSTTLKDGIMTDTLL